MWFKLKLKLEYLFGFNCVRIFVKLDGGWFCRCWIGGSVGEISFCFVE